MNKDIQKLFKEVVGVSLNSDQVNSIAQQMDRRFDIREASGFGSVIAIPGHAAAEALIHFLKTEERVVEFFERMLDQDGKFVYDSTVKIAYKEEMMRVLDKQRWIFDASTKRFFRDPFHAEQLNFLKSIEMIDLRNATDVGKIAQPIQEEMVRLKIEDLSWQVTLRTYRLTGESAVLLRDLIALLLSKQNLGTFSSEVYTCLNELAINASKATYKFLFEKNIAKPQGIDPQISYHAFMDMFRQELEAHGDENLSRMAREEDKYFDIHLKSTEGSISCWCTNYTTITRQEKLRLMQKLNFTLFGDNLSELLEDPSREGAGLGINLVLTVLGKLSLDKNPLKPVFYPDRTKIGFLLKRADLARPAATATAT
ncbi:MAG: hypothetical protein JNM27_05255 [Leptospirales bacterium]|nr:hypothetical protein [Leptospirales bacterium]